MNDRAAWLDWRRQGLGASDIPKLLGLSTHGTPYTVWADKCLPPRDEAMSDRLQLGLDLEDFIGSQFTKQTGLYVAGQQTWCEHHDEPWMRCTVDGLAYDGPNAADHSDALGPVQMKTDARYGPWKTIPDDMAAQVQWEMHVTGHDHAWLVVFHGNFRIEVYPVDRHDGDIAYMVATARAFWLEHVVTGVPPAMTGMDAELDILAEQWPDTLEGATVDLAPELVAEWRSVKAQAGALGREIKRLSAEIRSALTDAEYGTVDGEPVVTCRTVTVDAHTVDAYTYRRLDAIRGKKR